jgi:hypothetical protein
MKVLDRTRHGYWAPRFLVALGSAIVPSCGADPGPTGDATGGAAAGSLPANTSSPPAVGAAGAAPATPTLPSNSPEGIPSLPLASSNGGAAGVPGEAGGGGTATAGNGGAGTDVPVQPGCLNAGSGDHSIAGPYRVATEVIDLGSDIAPNQGTGEFTIFYPQPFEASCPHPIVAWGNGTGVVGPNVYEFFNRNAASWGIVVIAAHDSNTGSGNYHRAGIDYLLQANTTPDGIFFGKLSGRAGVSGHSQGGFGASQAASHPNVRALLPVGASGRALETTAFLCLTGTEDIAPDACRSAVQSAPGPAMAAIWNGGDHVTTETIAGILTGDPGTIQMMRLYAAWFRCFLADDEAACGLFEGGDSCGICADPGWSELVTNNL